MHLLQSVRGRDKASPFEWEEVAEVQTLENLDIDQESDEATALALRWWKLMCNSDLCRLSLRQHR